jgi:hypothetical protein
VKLAGFLPVLLAIPAFPQSASHGARIAQVQTAYLEDVPAAIATALDISDRFRDIVEAARSTGAARGAVTPDGRVLTPAVVSKGPRAEFETWVEQMSRDYAESVVTGVTGIERAAGKATVHRFIRDNFRNIYLTYTMTFEAILETETFRVSFSESDVPYPAPQILRDGETIALTLLADGGTGRRLVDYIRVGSGPLKPRQQVARDVYAEDAELIISQPRLRTNGVEQQAGSVPATLSAPAVWVYIPGQGRYLLSFKPRAGQGFEKAGEVAENALVFSSGGNTFRIECADRIASGSGTYNIYVRKDSAPDPPDPTRFAVGAAP